ncbi:MAG: GNAT family N-acetyltransferase [Acidobacteriota bacterium]
MADPGGTVTVFPLTPERWPDLEALFGPRGACGGCWCMWWRLSRKDFETGKGQSNRAAFHDVVHAGPPPGLLAYVGGAPAGWCALAPRSDYPRLARSRILKPVDGRPVWSVTCFYIRRGRRGRQLSLKLLVAAVRYAASCGAEILEGYPVDPKSGRAADAFVYTGLASTFRRAGFREVARRSETRPIMRLDLSTAR